MTPDVPPFRFWIRRSPGSDASYALRYEVFDGKGVLRVARPGRLVDPPARGSGYEPDLTPAGVRASQFVHLSASGNRRQTWFLSRVAEPLLTALKPGAWLELLPVLDMGAPHLVVQQLPEAHAAPLAATPSNPGLQNIPTLPPEALSPLSAEPSPRRPRRGASPPVIPEDPTSRALVRHLRRQLAEARLQSEVLEGRVRELERKLALGDYFPEPIEAEAAPEDLADLY